MFNSVMNVGVVDPYLVSGEKASGSSQEESRPVKFLYNLHYDSILKRVKSCASSLTMDDINVLFKNIKNRTLCPSKLFVASCAIEGRNKKKVTPDCVKTYIIDCLSKCHNEEDKFKFLSFVPDSLKGKGDKIWKSCDLWKTVWESIKNKSMTHESIDRCITVASMIMSKKTTMNILRDNKLMLTKDMDRRLRSVVDRAFCWRDDRLRYIATSMDAPIDGNCVEEDCLICKTTSAFSVDGALQNVSVGSSSVSTKRKLTDYSKQCIHEYDNAYLSLMADIRKYVDGLTEDHRLLIKERVINGSLPISQFMIAKCMIEIYMPQSSGHRIAMKYVESKLKDCSGLHERLELLKYIPQGIKGKGGVIRLLSNDASVIWEKAKCCELSADNMESALELLSMCMSYSTCNKIISSHVHLSFHGLDICACKRIVNETFHKRAIELKSVDTKIDFVTGFSCFGMGLQQLRRLISSGKLPTNEVVDARLRLENLGADRTKVASWFSLYKSKVVKSDCLSCSEKKSICYEIKHSAFVVKQAFPKHNNALPYKAICIISKLKNGTLEFHEFDSSVEYLCGILSMHVIRKLVKKFKQEALTLHPDMKVELDTLCSSMIVDRPINRDRLELVSKLRSGDVPLSDLYNVLQSLKILSYSKEIRQALICYISEQIACGVKEESILQAFPNNYRFCLPIIEVVNKEDHRKICLFRSLNIGLSDLADCVRSASKYFKKVWIDHVLSNFVKTKCNTPEEGFTFFEIMNSLVSERVISNQSVVGLKHVRSLCKKEIKHLTASNSTLCCNTSNYENDWHCSDKDILDGLDYDCDFDMFIECLDAENE